MKIMIGGDISPTDYTRDGFVSGDFDTLFNDAKSVFEGNDYNFVNLECALTDHDKSIEKFGPAIKAPPVVAHKLRELGVTHCGISNNHVFDFGKKGAFDTIKALNDAGIPYTGFGDNAEDARKDMIIEKNGEKVCIIAVCEHEYSYALDDRAGCREYDVYKTIEDIRAAKETADKVIVAYHGGKEYCPYPSPRLRNAFQAMARAGADLVVGQHSHCICCYENYNGSHLIYGQGNFNFVEPRDDYGSYDGQVVIYDTDNNAIEFVYCTAKENGIELAKGEHLKELKSSFEKRSEELKSNVWKEKWHENCESLRVKYVERIRRSVNCEDYGKAYNDLGHFLDCEAHHDLICELFPTANSTNEK